jgi:hypothetical protein
MRTERRDEPSDKTVMRVTASGKGADDGPFAKQTQEANSDCLPRFLLKGNRLGRVARGAQPVN